MIITIYAVGYSSICRALLQTVALKLWHPFNALTPGSSECDLKMQFLILI